MTDFGFAVGTTLPDGRGRTGVIRTPHGEIRTPAFVAVGTKATVKAVLPESVADLGAQAVLANAYHLYLQPGSDIVDADAKLASHSSTACVISHSRFVILASAFPGSTQSRPLQLHAVPFSLPSISLSFRSLFRMVPAIGVQLLSTLPMSV